jgi:hypothetical protein
MCPNCRQDADLEAPVDVETETWEAILRTSDSRTPSTEPGASQEAQVKMINFQPMPDVTTSSTPRDPTLADHLHSLRLNHSGNLNSNPPESLEMELDLTRTLSPGVTNLDNPPPSRTASRNTGALATPPVYISRRVPRLSAARRDYEDLASLSTTPTIDRGPFVYGDMTVNADGTAEATTSTGGVVVLPRESVSEDVGITLTKG